MTLANSDGVSTVIVSLCGLGLTWRGLAADSNGLGGYPVDLARSGSATATRFFPERLAS